MRNRWVIRVEPGAFYVRTGIAALIDQPTARRANTSTMAANKAGPPLFPSLRVPSWIDRSQCPPPLNSREKAFKKKRAQLCC